MNILYLTAHLNVGGITSYVFSLCRGLKAQGHNVHVASSGGDFLDRFIQAGINYIRIPIKTKSEIDPRILLSSFKLRKYIQENNIDILHANTRVTQVLGCLVSKFSDKPYISTCHGFFKKRFFRRLFPCWGLRVIAISRQVKEHLQRDFKIPEDKIRVIHNGIDFNRYSTPDIKSRAEARKSFGLGAGPVIGIIARLSDVKGHIYLIEAIKGVLAKIPDVQLLIVGEGRQEQRLRDLSKRLNLQKNLFFVSSVTDTLGALAAMDIFVMPSLQEGLGLSLMEAMACGIPVIGSDVGGIKSLIQNNWNGLLVPPADSAALSGAIQELLKDRDKAKDLGDKARIFIKQNFSQSEMVSQTEKLYLECLNEKI